MTYKAGQHMYLAAGFFNDEQRALCEFVESFESSLAPIYSPRKDGGVLRPTSSQREISMTFDNNKISIENARWVLAVIDDFDPGVMWEMGYAHAKGVSILGYSDVMGRGLNVMLAGACNLGFVNGRDSLQQIIVDWRSGFWNFPKNTWSGEIQ